MGRDTPNLLSRETTFLVGILKKCLSVEKTSEEPNNQISLTSVSGHSVPLTEEDPLMSTEGVFSHCHSVPSTEDRSERSHMNCASISDMAETPDFSSNRVSGSNNHSLSIADLPLTQDKVDTTYADVFQGLGKFPGDPYKLRLKPDAVPAKHRPRKVPVHLQDAFHEEVE